MGLRNRTLFSEESCFFVTTTCQRWLNLLAVGRSIELVANSLHFCNKKYNGLILGYVIMPNHLHFVIVFTKQNFLSDYMRDFKKFTSFQIRKEIEINAPHLLDIIRIKKKERVFQVWNDRFDDVVVNSRKQAEQTLEYIHNNPLQEKWMLADNPEAYVFSSAGFYMLDSADMFDLVTDYKDFF